MSILNFLWYNVGIIPLFFFLIYVSFFVLSYKPKIRSFKEFAIGNKKNSLSSLIYALSLLCMGNIIVIFYLYQDPFYIIIASFGCVVIFGLYHKMLYWFFEIDLISIIDSINEIYNQKIKTLFIASSIFFCLTNLLVIFYLVFFLFQDGIVLSIFYCGLIVFFTYFSGADGAIKINLPQIFIFIFCTIILSALLCESDYKWELNIFLDEAFADKVTMCQKKQGFFDYIFILVYLFTSFTHPAIYRCICMVSKKEEVENMITMMFLLLIALTIGAILFFLLKDHREAQYYMFKVLRDEHYSFKRIIATICILSVVFINASLNLNVATILFSNDLYKVWRFEMSDASQEKFAQLLCLILGIAVIAIASVTPSVQLIFSISCSIYIDVVLLPIFLTKIGFRTTDSSMWFAIVSTTIFIIAISVIFNTNAVALGFIVFIMSLISYAKLYHQPLGWVVRKIITEKDDT